MGLYVYPIVENSQLHLSRVPSTRPESKLWMQKATTALVRQLCLYGISISIFTRGTLVLEGVVAFQAGIWFVP